MKMISILKIFFSLSVIFLVTSCYTVLRHPSVIADEKPNDNETISHGWVDHDSKCAKCHDQHDYRFNDYEAGYFLYPSHNSWNDYYTSPWWVYPDDTNDSYDTGGGMDNNTTPGQRRRFGRRTEVAPNSPASTSVPSTSTNSTTPTSTSNTSLPSVTPTSSSASGNSSSSPSSNSSSNQNNPSNTSATRRTDTSNTTSTGNSNNTNSSSSSSGNDRRTPKKD